jgi:hypothetical protein
MRPHRVAGGRIASRAGLVSIRRTGGIQAPLAQRACARGRAGFAGYGSFYETVVVLSRRGVCVTIPFRFTSSAARGRGRTLIPIPPCGVLLWARIHAACVGSALRQLGIGVDTRATVASFLAEMGMGMGMGAG